MVTKKIRTQHSAGEVNTVSPIILAITNKEYQNALTFNTNNRAYLQLILIGEELKFSDTELCFNGMPIMGKALRNYYKKDGKRTIDLALLRVLYTILYESSEKDLGNNLTPKKMVTIYYPKLAKQLGKSLNIGAKDVQCFINKLRSYESVVGIIDEGKESKNILPVLRYWEWDVVKNTISFDSPYMSRIISEIYYIHKGKNNDALILKNKNMKPLFQPVHSYMMNASIAKEKNKKAVEIVFIVVVLIEQAGGKDAHIKANTIIERNLLLKEAIEQCKTINNKNIILKRSFSKAWELLLTKTNLTQYYKNIELPDVDAEHFIKNWIPTITTLNMNFEFKHEGKIKNKKSE